jgi:hypothetical protein
LESNPTIRTTKHSLDRWLQRDVDLDYIYECLNMIPLAIIKQNLNLFKLLYSHNTKKSLDLAIIIGINDFQEI